jgi:hypothetical protein
MGAEFFYHRSEGKTAKSAFLKAVDQAQYDHGHSGYTGTIAEKTSFVMIDLPKSEDPYTYASELCKKCDHRIDDKWGPAGCFDLKDWSFYFFGWARA